MRVAPCITHRNERGTVGVVLMRRSGLYCATYYPDEGNDKTVAIGATRSAAFAELVSKLGLTKTGPWRDKP